MVDDMNDDELAELLRLVDEPVEEVPIAYERRLWEELAATFEALPTRDVDGEGVRPVQSEDLAFVPVDARPDGRARWLRWGSLAAALVAVLAVGALMVRRDDEPDRVTEPSTSTAPVATLVPTTQTETIVPPVAPVVVEPDNSTDAGAAPEMLDPVEACQRFRVGAAPLVHLPDALTELDTVGAGRSTDDLRTDVETVRAAFETYAAALDVGGFLDEAQVTEFGNLARTLDQAVAELDAGDRDAATRTVGVARSRAGTLLPELEVPGLRYDPFGDLLIECAD